MTIPVVAETYTLYSGQIYQAAFRNETPEEVLGRIGDQLEARMTPAEIRRAHRATMRLLRKHGQTI